MKVVRAQRRRMRETLRPRWLDAREPILAAVALVALVFGTIGFLQAAGQHFTFLDALYRALLLFVLGGAVAYKVPLLLQIARFLAPLALGFAAVRGIFSLFRAEFEVIRIRLFMHDHVVVVGLGSSGLRLVRSFYAEGWPVVVIERDPGNPHIAAAEERAVPVLVGDATDPAVLRKARLTRARYLLVACGDDGLNFDVAMAAADRVASRSLGVLTAFVHIADLRLWRGLKAQAAAAINPDAFRLELFNVHFTAAHLMVDQFSPFEDSAGNELEDPHVCVVGLEGIGEGLVLRIATLWRSRHPQQKLKLTLAGPGADGALATLLDRYPELSSICELDCRPAETGSARFQRGGALLDEHGNCDITRAYVALESQSASLAAALGLHGSAATAAVPVTVALDDAASGTARAMRGNEGPAFAHAVDAFGVLSAALTPAITLQGMNELIARQQQAEYVRECEAEGKHSDAAVPWEQLDERYKDSNRRFADGIGKALAIAGCALAPAPLLDPSSQLFEFSDAEIEVLAQGEHERWRADLARAGWRYGPTKDPVRKTHPSMVQWSELSETDRQSNRESMRDLPRTLAAVGLEIYRLAPAGAAPAGPDPDDTTGQNNGIIPAPWRYQSRSRSSRSTSTAR